MQGTYTWHDLQCVFLCDIVQRKKKKVFSHQQHRQQLFHIDSLSLYEFPHHVAVTHRQREERARGHH